MVGNGTRGPPVPGQREVPRRSRELRGGPTGSPSVGEGQSVHRVPKTSPWVSENQTGWSNSVTTAWSSYRVPEILKRQHFSISARVDFNACLTRQNIQLDFLWVSAFQSYISLRFDFSPKALKKGGINRTLLCWRHTKPNQKFVRWIPKNPEWNSTELLKWGKLLY